MDGKEKRKEVSRQGAKNAKRRGKERDLTPVKGPAVAGL